MSQTFSIPQPCGEDWGQMTPAKSGRHCALCNHTVIDFSGWKEDEISAYLFAQQANKVCGRFREDQVAEVRIAPAAYLYQVMTSGLDFLKKVAAILLFALCISEASIAQQNPQKDTTAPMIMGKMIPPATPIMRHPKHIVGKPAQQHITGLIAPRPYPAKDSVKK